MKCLRPIVVRVPIGSWICDKCSGDGQRRVRRLSQRKIIDFFRIQKSKKDDIKKKCSPLQGFASNKILLKLNKKLPGSNL
ncbi:hypothetical protein OIU78_021070 [Salix suchowensis]|nr:hypothetical protein OIU78_021070 [Salix suchowensis]